jgi:superfamily II DNA/RNA helicase
MILTTLNSQEKYILKQSSIENFEQLGLPTKLLESLRSMNISTPTSIQQATLPLALEGSDILASAQTGSGKTLAYCLPLIVKLLQNPKTSALILTPTRELATQVQQCLNQVLGTSSSLKTVLLIGGAAMFPQIRTLKAKPRVIIGTPGRITDHLLRGSLSLKDTGFLVVDEADRMLDMGFDIQLSKIAEFLPAERQTLMFSATLPPHIDRLAKDYLKNPKRISIDTTAHTAPKIKQEVIRTTHTQKFDQLLEQLKIREGSVIIFTKTKRGADHLSDDLNSYGHTSNAIHGDLSQNRRDSVIRAFRKNINRILVATDVAARGLDIPHIMHVINYDLPQCPEDYIHRIGRTARAGAEGHALCFVSPSDRGKWREILRLIDPSQLTSQGGQEERPERSHPKGRAPWGNKGQSRGSFRSAKPKFFENGLAKQEDRNSKPNFPKRSFKFARKNASRRPPKRRPPE